MIKEVLSLEAKLQTRPFSNLHSLQKAYIEIVRAPSEQGVAADRRGVRESNAFDPMDVRRTGASVCIRIAIAALAGLRSSGGPDDSAAAERSRGIADVRAVRRPVVAIPVKAVNHRVWGSRLKSSDSGNRPAARQSLPDT